MRWQAPCPNPTGRRSNRSCPASTNTPSSQPPSRCWLPGVVPFRSEGPPARVRGARVLVSRIAASRGSGGRAALQPGGDARALPGHRRRGGRRYGACAGAGRVRFGIRGRARPTDLSAAAAHRPPRRGTRRDSGRHRLEHRLRPGEPAALHCAEPQLVERQVRRVRGVARRCPLPRAPGRDPRPDSGGGKPARGVRRPHRSGQSALPADRPRRLGGSFPAPHRRVRAVASLPAMGRAADARERLGGPARQSRVVVARARQRPAGVRHLAGRRGPLSRHRARGQGRVEHGQLARARRGHADSGKSYPRLRGRGSQQPARAGGRDARAGRRGARPRRRGAADGDPGAESRREDPGGAVGPGARGVGELAVVGPFRVQHRADQLLSS